MDYKADITLNEKDSLFDLLTLEKNLVKVYAQVLTESISKGFYTLVKNLLNETAAEQSEVFLMLTDSGYYRVESAPEDELLRVRRQFSPALKELS